MYKTTLKDVKENEKNFNKKSPYIIKFQIGDNLSGTYRVSREKFLAIKNELEPYRSLPIQPKKIKCIETGRIFESANEAMATDNQP